MKNYRTQVATSLALAALWCCTSNAQATEVTYSYPGSVCSPAEWSFLEPDYFNAGTPVLTGSGIYYDYAGVSMDSAGYGQIVCPLIKHTGFTYISGVTLVGSSSTHRCQLVSGSRDGVVDGLELDSGISTIVTGGALDPADFYWLWCWPLSTVSFISGFEVTESN